MNIRRLIPFGLVVMTALLWSPSSSSGQGGASTPPCNCTGDKKDLESRINQLNAVEKELERLIKEWSTDARKDVKLDPNIRDNIAGVLAFRLATSKTPGARAYDAHTYPSTCESTYDSRNTPCIKAGLEAHEAVHKKACDAVPVKMGGGWKMFQKVVDYLKEDQQAYRDEKAKLESEYNRLKASCNPFITTLDRYQTLEEPRLLAQRERVQGSGNRLKFVAEALN